MTEKKKKKKHLVMLEESTKTSAREANGEKTKSADADQTKSFFSLTMPAREFLERKQTKIESRSWKLKGLKDIVFLC